MIHSSQEVPASLRESFSVGNSLRESRPLHLDSSRGSVLEGMPYVASVAPAPLGATGARRPPAATQEAVDCNRGPKNEHLRLRVFRGGRADLNTIRFGRAKELLHHP